VEQVSLREYCEEVRSLIQAGRPDKAISILRHILSHYPRHLESYRLLGQALQAAGNYQQAAMQFQRVLSADPEDVVSRVGLAEIDAATGDLDQAIWQIQCAVEATPDDADLRLRLGRMMGARQAGDTPEPPELTRVALGHIHARGGLYAKAAQEFKAALTHNPNRVDVQTALAEALWRAGHHLEAVEVCRRILDKLPNALKANLIIGAMWLANSQPDEAEPHLRLVQALDPDNTVAQSLLGERSPLPPLTVKIERLAEDQIGDARSKPPPTPPAEVPPGLQPSQPAIDWTSRLPEEEPMATNDAERPDEDYELPDWLKGLGDDLLEEKDEQPAAAGPSESDVGEDEATPGWLRSLVSRAEEAGPSAESLPAEPGDLPDWLHELRPEAPQEPSTDSGTPDWLVSTAADQPPDYFQSELASGLEESAPAPSDSEADQMDWLTQAESLAEPSVSLEAAGEPTAPAEEGRALWERMLAEEEPAQPSSPAPLLDTAELVERPPEALPETELPELPTVPLAVPAAADTGLPAWLKDLQEAETLLKGQVDQPAPPPPVEERKPSLLEPVSGIVEEWDVPDWLREIAAGEEAQPAEPQPITSTASTLPEVEIDETGLPDWLRDFEKPPAEEAELAAQAVSPEVAAQPEPSLEEGRALWEQILAQEGVDLTSAQEAPPAEAAGMTAEEWLRTTADLVQAPSPPRAEQPAPAVPEAPTTPGAEEEAREAGPPAWMRDVGKPFEAEEVPAAGIPTEAQLLPDWLSETAQPAPAEAPSYQAGLPDWLSQIMAGDSAMAQGGEPVTPAAGAELPDWLRASQEPAAEVQPPAEPEVMPEPPQAAVPEAGEAELSEWLREPSAETTEFPEPAAEPSAAMPEWLTELETQEILLAESDLEEPVELETGEMPEWLGEIMAGEPPLSEEWAAVSDMAGLAEAETPEEQIPDWLRDYRAREWQVTPEPAAEVVEPEPLPEAEAQPEYIPQTELPDWLTRLREGVPEEAEAPAAEVEAMPAGAPVEGEAAPPFEMFPEPEAIQPEAVGPDWLGELVRAEESLAELEAITAEEPVLPEAVAPRPEERFEFAEVPLPAPAEVEPELFEPAVSVEIPAPRPLSTRELEMLQIEDLPRDPAARLSMARAALNAGDWAEALTIYRTLVTSSEMLDSVIDNLQIGLRRHPDDANGYELLGDAFVKDGRLQDALQAYRTALAKL
jgi:tetratricopeptide (TPR) repeat protein